MTDNRASSEDPFGAIADEFVEAFRQGKRPSVDVVRGLLTGEFRKPDQASAHDRARRACGRGGRAGGPLSRRFGGHPLARTEQGSTLSDSGRPYWQSVARIGMQVADALAHAASLGVLHRDVKPSNLLLDETGNVWVTDFGLAKAVGDGDDLTHTGDVVGTLRYVTPECFNGLGDVRSDVYSLGLRLYELLTLRPAFDETDRNKLVRQVESTRLP